MKTVGFMCAWASEQYIKPVIENHLKICDEIYIAIAPHHPEFYKFEDKTQAIALKNYENDPRITFINTEIPSKNRNADQYKCNLLNVMVVKSGVKKDDIIMICDADEFYDDAAIAEIKSNFPLFDWDMLRVRDRFFVVDKTWYVESFGHGRFMRVKDSCRFIPTQKMIPTPKNVKTIIEKHPMFHYSMLLDKDFKKTYWSTGSSKCKYRIEWLEQVYSAWKPEDHALCAALAKINHKITGIHGFWFNKGVIEAKELPYVFKYNGEHPV